VNDLWNTLFGLEDLRLGDAGVRISFSAGYEPWLWAVLIVGAVGFAVWSYSKLDAGRISRGLLACARALTLVVLLALLAGPQAEKRDELIERDWVVLLIDRSASLTIADAPALSDGGGATGGASERVPREAQLRAALASAGDTLSGFAADRQLLVLGFDGSARDVRLDALGEPDGRRTSLRAALDEAVSRTAARPLAGVVVMSDGRSADAPSRGALRRLREDAAPVIAVPLGSERPIADLALRAAEAPRLAFAGDSVPVTAEIERLGGGDGEVGLSAATVRLVDTQTGLVLDEQRITFGGGGDNDDAGAGDGDGERTGRETVRVLLRAGGNAEGDRSWRVEVEPDGEDLVADNNARPISIEFVGRPLRVLYVDGYPRWEQRYLRNLLIREPSIDASTLILAPDRRYLQEGNTDIDAIPSTVEAWREYDAVMLGDVRPDVFTNAQLASLREHVASTGAALVWSAGPGSVPGLWFDTPLADLLPFGRGAFEGRSLGVDAVARPTDQAELLGVLRLGSGADEAWPAALADPGAGWSRLRYVQQIQPGGLKPTARVLAQAIAVPSGLPVAGDAGSRSGGVTHPLVLLMRYGAGSSLYVATDETWRWRYGLGETLFERFWLQLVRALSRDRLARTDRAALLTATPRRALVEQPVLINLDVFDQRLIERAPASAEVSVTREAEDPSLSGGESASAARLTLRRASRGTDQAAAGRGLALSATWLPPAPGTWTVRLDDRSLIAEPLSATVDVSFPLDELRRPETDHAALARLAQDTGGEVVPPAELARIADLLPNRERRTVALRTEPIWDAPIVLALLIALLTIEWLGRRAVRLV
jgi:hypothetical protein